MISVGVRDLKNQLSQYLQHVKRGERVLITEHNRVIAELSLPREEETGNDVEELLDRLAAEGKLQRAARNSSTVATEPDAGKVDWISSYRENRNEK